MCYLGVSLIAGEQACILETSVASEFLLCAVCMGGKQCRLGHFPLQQRGNDALDFILIFWFPAMVIVNTAAAAHA
jgi:hypothetical protein